MSFQQLTKDMKLPLLRYQMCLARSKSVPGASQDSSAEDLEFIFFFYREAMFFQAKLIFLIIVHMCLCGTAVKKHR